MLTQNLRLNKQRRALKSTEIRYNKGPVDKDKI